MEILVIIAVFWVVGKILKGCGADSGSLITERPIARWKYRHAGHRQDIHSHRPEVVLRFGRVCGTWA